MNRPGPARLCHDALWRVISKSAQKVQTWTFLDDSDTCFKTVSSFELNFRNHSVACNTEILPFSMHFCVKLMKH